MQKITASDPLAQSADVVQDNVSKLRALFPDVFIEGKVDLDALKQLLTGTVEEREEKYGLNWHGKRRARQLALTPSTGTLRPAPKDSVDWDATQNLMIEGDNLEVLKLLQKSYAGKVKLIYIDPPYNTGKDFVYPDDYRDSIKNYRQISGQVDGDGYKVTSNTEANGRFHTDWLNMIYPRLKLARSMLSDDGIIAISIDDKELANLQQVCNEIFGPEGHKGTVVRTTGQTTGQDGGGLGSSFDYLLLYAKSEDAELSGLPLTESDIERYQDSDARGKYALWQLRKTGSNDRRTDRPNMFFAVKGPDGKEVWPIGPTGYESCWRFDRKGYERLIADDFIVWKPRPSGDGESGWWPYVKTYLEGRTKRASPLWDDLPGSKKASIDLRALMGGDIFDNPKPVDVILRLLQILPASKEPSLIVDFFAGSGTTAHAVMLQNVADGGDRRFALVQLPETLDATNKNQTEAAEFCDKLGRPRNIAELTKERIRRAGAALKSANPMFTGDVGFRVFKLDESNLQAWSSVGASLEKDLIDNVEHIKANRSEADVLTELLLKLGLDLCVPIQHREIVGKSVYAIGGGVLMACLDMRVDVAESEGLALGIVKWQQELKVEGDVTCVFRDSAFGGNDSQGRPAADVVKTNLSKILEQHGVANVRSI